ncbi:MAG: hypothetical protein HZA93_00270 [Verrucomicrobia bacterium]|nr:hypothetical protein [Verrucomicrobiota bacterium]
MNPGLGDGPAADPQAVAASDHTSIPRDRRLRIRRGGRTGIKALGVLLCLGWTACTHYQLGTGARPTFQSIYVEPVANKTLVPQAREAVTTHLRQTLLRDARLTLAHSPENADATLRVTITDFHRDTASPREGDTGLARKFNLTLGAACTLRDNRSGRTIVEARPISVQREAFTDSGQLQSEYQTIPLLAESLAGKIAHAILDVW